MDNRLRKLTRPYSNTEPWRVVAHSRDTGETGLVLHWDQVRREKLGEN